MKRKRLMIAAAMMAALIAVPVAAEITYTSVNTTIPVGGSYPIDLNHDGIVDFTIRSVTLLEENGRICIGEGWFLTATPATGNAVETEPLDVSTDFAAALLNGSEIGSGQGFYSGSALMAELFWGGCGIGTGGQWLNVPNRYLGLRFTDPLGKTHYGWAKMNTVAYVDSNGALHASTFLSGFAYETIAGQPIAAGQMSDGNQPPPPGDGLFRR